MEALSLTTCLVIRAPNQKISDHPIDCPLDWSVYQLKLHLSKVYPSKPKPEDQRLIYSGRLLENQTILKDIFQLDTSRTHILHLVCKSSREPSEGSTSHPPIPLDSGSGSSSAAANDQLAALHSSSSAATGSSSTSIDGIRHRGSSASHNTAQVAPTGPEPQLPFQFPGLLPGAASPEQVMQQMVMAQQLYAQYFSQYMQLVNQGTDGVHSQVPTTPTATVAPPSVAQQQANQAAPRAAAENRGPRMNAQGGPLLDEDDDDEVHRDWLDWLYTVGRATVLLGIVYFYSSFGRFLVVTGIAMLVYLYQNDWFARPRQQRDAEQHREGENVQEAGERPNRAPPLHRPQMEEPQEEVPRVPEGQAEREADMQHLEAMMDGDRDGPVVAVERHLHRVTMAWTFVSSFFTSLIPERPPPVNVN
uniref:Putative cysteine-responsive endoplasmic reticulum-resident ubiquitin-like domain member 2 protein n=1 Tax=Ornithodoros turicata TaxID=34597 RepID=A0A2R5LKD4_9ACAR